MRYLTDSHNKKEVDNCSIHEFRFSVVLWKERIGVSAFKKDAEHNNKKQNKSCVYAEAE
ncbi:MAG: hypothetical protein ACLS9K_07375 [Lachnospira eligens]